jgi:hypothetical protein
MYCAGSQRDEQHYQVSKIGEKVVVKKDVIGDIQKGDHG